MKLNDRKKLEEILIAQLRNHDSDLMAMIKNAAETTTMLADARKEEYGLAISNMCAEVDAMASSLRSRMAAELMEALRRLQNNDSFTCIGCGEEIDLKRLSVVPNTRYCRNCMHTTHLVAQSRL